jgi:RimJ/RimL family protein N-acetyltransferase
MAWKSFFKENPILLIGLVMIKIFPLPLDLFICELNYLGKGIAVPMIQEFLISHFSNVKRVLIDPEATNKRAIHVYQKVGFKIIGEFIASWHPVPHYQNYSSKYPIY